MSDPTQPDPENQLQQHMPVRDDEGLEAEQARQADLEWRDRHCLEAWEVADA